MGPCAISVPLDHRHQGAGRTVVVPRPLGLDERVKPVRDGPIRLGRSVLVPERGPFVRPGLCAAVGDVPRLSPFVRHHLSIDGHYSFHLPTSAAATVRCVTRTPQTMHKACRWPTGDGHCTGRSAGPAISARSFPSTMRDPHLDIEGVPDPDTSPGSARPIRPDKRPGVSGFTAQKSSATSSVLVAPRHLRKD